MKVLVPNLGSTSLKYELFDMDREEAIVGGLIESIGGESSTLTIRSRREESREQARVRDHDQAIDLMLTHLGGHNASGGQIVPDAVALKAVHAGPSFTSACLLTDEVIDALEEYCAVAPSHNAMYVNAITRLRAILPGTPMVAVLEPGFHRTIPACAHTYGIPYEWTRDLGIRRYGFHGVSHSYVAARVEEILGGSSRPRRLVSCHLGGSSSVCAISEGESVDCSFGFSPQSGLEQGTRCGDVDPFVLLYVMERKGLSPAEMSDILCKRSGLLGVSGVSGLFREVEEAALQGNDRAALAVDVFVHGIKKHVGAFAAEMGGLDVLAFAGGIGERSWRLRERVCSGLEFLGLELDLDRNRALRGEGTVSAGPSATPVVVIHTNEALVVAREAVRVLESS